MNSREIVRRTLNFDYPERIIQSLEPSDFVFAGPEIPNPLGKWRKIDERQWQRTDEWGNVWGRVDDPSKGQIIHGIFEDLGEVSTFPLPDFANAANYSRAKEIFAQQPDKWHIGSVQGFTFKMAQQLRRFGQYLMDLVVEPRLISQLHDRIHEQILRQIKRLQQVGADSIMFWEDWGTQSYTYISTKLWRTEFKPRFMNLIADVHALGLSVIMHSCGKITSILPDLIECGVDIFQFDQPRIHGIETLNQLQQGRVTFWCPVDIRTTLQSKEETRIHQEVGELMKKLWKGQGGFIAGFYEDEASIGLKPYWQKIACEEFLRQGTK